MKDKKKLAVFNKNNKMKLSETLCFFKSLKWCELSTKFVLTTNGVFDKLSVFSMSYLPVKQAK